MPSETIFYYIGEMNSFSDKHKCLKYIIGRRKDSSAGKAQDTRRKVNKNMSKYVG